MVCSSIQRKVQPQTARNLRENQIQAALTLLDLAGLTLRGGANRSPAMII
jgi:hypothetical protein